CQQRPAVHVILLPRGCLEGQRRTAARDPPLLIVIPSAARRAIIPRDIRPGVSTRLDTGRRQGCNPLRFTVPRRGRAALRESSRKLFHINKLCHEQKNEETVRAWLAVCEGRGVK